MEQNGTPEAVLAEISQLLQEQHDRVARCFEECMSGHDKILHRFRGYQNGQVCQPKFQNDEACQPKLQSDEASLRLISTPAADDKSRFNDGLSKVEHCPSPSKNGVGGATETKLVAARLDETRKSSHEEDDAREKAAAERDSAVVADDALDDEQPQRFLVKLVQNSKFEACISCAIVISASMIGIETHYMAEHLEDEVPLEFKIITWVLSFIFLVELVLRLMCEGVGFFCSKDWTWNWFDTFLVLCSLFEVTYDVVAITSDVEGTNVVRVARIVRAFRLSRIVRITRIIRFVSALHIMIQSILGTLRSLVWILVLLVMILYVCGILFTQAATGYLIDAPADKDVALVKEFWGTLGASMFTLYKSVTGGISWHEVVLPLGRMSWTWVGLFIAYVSLIYFAVLNVVTGFFCNSAIEHAKREPDMLIDSLIKDQAWHESGLKKLFSNLDNDKSDHIDIRELDAKLKDDKVKAWFAAMGLEIQDAWSLFKLIDEDGSHDVSVPEFVSRCMHLRGVARSIDLEMLRHEHKITTKKVWEMECRIEETLILDRQRYQKDLHRIEQYMVSISADLTRPVAQDDPKISPLR